MNRRSILLPVYRATTRGVRPFVAVVLGWRRRHGREDRHRVKERLGIAGLPRPEGRLVWVHVASAGDGRALMPLVERLGARGFNVLVSTRTLASGRALKSMLPPGSFHQFLPFDVPAYVSRFFEHWRPDMVVLAGAELWPNVLFEAGERNLPVIFVNAKMSDRIYSYCRHMRGLLAELMAQIDLCLVRADADAERFVEFGAAAVHTVGDLVFDQPLPGADPMEISAFSGLVGARPIWLAAMIDPEETALVIETHRRLLPHHPDLITVVVPRLPHDSAAIAETAARHGFEAALRSRDGWPQKLPNLFVADIAGEVGLFYRTSDIAFLGHSLSGGGRSPIDAAKLGCAILHGPAVDRHAEIYAALDEARGGATIGDAETLSRILGLLFEDGSKLRLMQRNATQTMERLCGGMARVMRAIEPHVVQMMVGR